MDAGELERTLRERGYRNTFSWQDAPGACYPDHTHPADTAHIVLEGEITLIVGGQTRILKPSHAITDGDVPAGATHSARIGPDGCRYIVGSKE